MNWQKSEILNPSSSYEEHIRSFESISNWLEKYYDGYSNSEKIISLLGYWLFAHKSFIVSYGIDGAIAFSKSGFGSHIRFSYQYEFGLNYDLEKNKKSSKVIFKIATTLLNVAYLPGGRVRSLFSKMAWRMTQSAVKNIPIVVQKNRKKVLISQLTDYFDGYDQSVIESILQNSLPSVFFADQVRLTAQSDLVVDCSAASFFDFCGYENILLFSRCLYLKGRQHGGGYDMFVDDYFSFFEKELCDLFIGWGMSFNNEHQHKYLLDKSRLKIHEGIKRLVWIEHARLPLVMFPISPTNYRQCSNLEAIKYINRELIDTDWTYFNLRYPGVLQSPDYIGKRGEELPSKRGKAEDILSTNDVVIFDISGASLVHYCLENEIIFLLVISRDDVEKVTNQVQEWFGMMRDCGLVFFDDEVGLLSRRIDEVMLDYFKVPVEITQYHKEHFIDLAPAGTL